MKNKAQTTFITVVLLAIVLSGVMYMYYYSPTKQNTDALKGTNKVLAERVKTLETFYNEMPQNKQQIADMQEGIREIIAEFPADVMEEDTIYFAIDSMQLQNLQRMYADNVIPVKDRFDVSIFEPTEDRKVDYTTLSINSPVQVAMVDSSVVEAANMEELVDTVVFRKREVDFQNVTTYSNLKGLIQSINNDPDKKTLARLSYNVGAEGKISGMVSVAFYSISGTTKEYVAKNLGEYVLGISDLFVNVTEE